MLLFFYIFVLLNLCIKAEECSVITISDTDDIVIDKDSPFVGFDDPMFSGYNGCYDRDTLDGYSILETLTILFPLVLVLLVLQRV